MRFLGEYWVRNVPGGHEFHWGPDRKPELSPCCMKDLGECTGCRIKNTQGKRMKKNRNVLVFQAVLSCMLMSVISIQLSIDLWYGKWSVFVPAIIGFSGCAFLHYVTRNELELNTEARIMAALA